MDVISRLIVGTGLQPGEERRILLQTLAKAFSGSETLLMRLASTGGQDGWSQPGLWVPRFQKLGAVTLRSALSGSAPYARLDLAGWPAPEMTRVMLDLLRRSFQWIVIDTPFALGPSETVMLEYADVLLWQVNPSKDMEGVFQAHQQSLRGRHFPEALCKVILAPCVKSESRNSWGGVPVVAAFQVESPVRFEAAVDVWASTLNAASDIFLPRSAPAGSMPVEAYESLKHRVQPQLLAALEPASDSPGTAAPSGDIARRTVEACLAQDLTAATDRTQREQLFNRMMEDVLGLGPLEPLLRDPQVSEIMINGHGSIFVEQKGKLHPVEIRFPDEQTLRTLIDRIVAPLGRRVDEGMPLCDARLKDGSRVNIILPPLALDGPAVTIRKFTARTPAIADLIAWRSLSESMAEYLRRAVRQRLNIIVSGGTGSGKTTLLNVLAGLIPDDERIVTIEDAAELRLPKPHVVRLESRPANVEGQGEIPIRRLVMNALRMRPDRIVVGECRGGEALDMLQAMNTGHDGSMTTLHANSPRDAMGRLETLVLMAGMDLPLRVVREQIRGAVHVVLQQARLADGSRKVISITELTGMEGELLTMQELFRYRRSPAAGGAFESTGLLSRHLGPGESA